MTEPQAKASKTEPQAKASSPIVGYVIVVYLIGSFLWRLLTPAHEYPGRFSTYLDMAVDLFLIAGLVTARAKLPIPLFWVAIIAGLGLFAIRLNSEASWWTGHLVYYLTPR
jgi:hypothetical protein